MLRISTTRKVWDFDFLRGLAPGPLDELSIEKESESFSHSPGKFEGGAMRFFCGGGGGGGNHPGESPGAGAVQKISFHLCPSIERHSKQRTRNLQNRSKTKERHYTAGKVRQRLLSVSPCTYLWMYRCYTEKANGESNTLIILLQNYKRLHKQIFAGFPVF